MQIANSCWLVGFFWPELRFNFALLWIFKLQENMFGLALVNFCNQKKNDYAKKCFKSGRKAAINLINACCVVFSSSKNHNNIQ